jgi:hypothetical protein
MTDALVPGETAPTGGGHRHVYRSMPDAPSLEDGAREFDRLASQVYAGIRDGALEPEATFDLACFLMDWGAPSPAVRLLAEQSVAGTDSARLAGLAGQVLEESGFEPGFDAEPWLLAEFEQALEVVKADMRATGRSGPVRLAFVEDSYRRHAFAEFRGSFSYTSGIGPGSSGDRVSALVAVADDVQDAIMSSLMTVWPVCPDHEFGGHPRETSNQAVWWCNGGASGHVIAVIGHWSS